MAELLPGIHRIETRFNDRCVAMHLLVGEKTLLVDSGFPWTATETILPYLEQANLPANRLDWLVVTHASADHHGGNSAVRARYPDVCITAHELDAQATTDGETFVREHGDVLVEYGFDPGVASPNSPAFREWHGEPAGVDWRVEGGERIDLRAGRTVTLVHAPGHTPGHLMVYDDAHGALIAGDALMGNGVPDVHGQLVMPPHYFEVDWYLRTIAAARTLAPRLILATHYPPIAGNAVEEFLQASEVFVETCNTMMQEIMEGATAPLGMPAIIQALRGRLGIPEADYQYALLARAHLRHLQEKGQLVSVSDGAIPRWLYCKA